MSRAHERSAEADITRIRLLEADADDFETGLASVNRRLDRMNTTLMGILISLATGAVLLAVNILVVSAR